MSWIIQSLLNDSNLIRVENDISSDAYNDLLLVEKAVKELEKRGLLSSDDLKIIDEMSGTIAGFESKPKTQKETESRKYVIICERLAFYMGGYFTDGGYLSYMTRKYKLTEEQVETLQNFMKSPYKHKIAQKTSSTGYSSKSVSQGTQ